MGNVSPARLTAVSELAEAERAKIVKLLKLDPAAPLVKGSLALFVLKRQFDYSEFVRMVEGREAPRGAAGHANTKGSDLYACLTANGENEEMLPALVAEQIAGGFLLSFENMPPWFAAGRAEPLPPASSRAPVGQAMGSRSAKPAGDRCTRRVRIGHGVRSRVGRTQLCICPQPDAEASHVSVVRGGAGRRARFRAGRDRCLSLERAGLGRIVAAAQAGRG